MGYVVRACVCQRAYVCWEHHRNRGKKLLLTLDNHYGTYFKYIRVTQYPKWWHGTGHKHMHPHRIDEMCEIHISKWWIVLEQRTLWRRCEWARFQYSENGSRNWSERKNKKKTGTQSGNESEVNKRRTEQWNFMNQIKCVLLLPPLLLLKALAFAIETHTYLVHIITSAYGKFSPIRELVILINSVWANRYMNTEYIIESL